MSLKLTTALLLTLINMPYMIYSQTETANSQSMQLQLTKRQSLEKIENLKSVVNSLSAQLEQAETLLAAIKNCAQQGEFYNQTTQTCTANTSSNSNTTLTGDNCGSQSVSWSSCHGRVTPGDHTQIKNIGNNRAHYSGSAIVQCFNGTWNVVSINSCTYHNPNPPIYYNEPQGGR